MSFIKETLSINDNKNTGLIHYDSLDKIIFPIETKSLLLKDVDGNHYDSGYKAIIRSDNNSITYVGKNYKLVSNEQIINDICTPLFDEGFKLHKVREISNKFEINLKNPDITGRFLDNDYFMRVRINNSYDGSTALSAQLGIYVQICSNGAVMGKDLAFLRQKHTAKLELNMAQFQNSVHNTLSRLNSKSWDKSESEVENQFYQLVDKIPDPVNGLHPTKMLLDKQFDTEYNKYHNKEFALFMAASYIGTHGHQMGIAPSYQLLIDNMISQVFFN